MISSKTQLSNIMVISDIFTKADGCPGSKDPV